jgi:hypothetical protein
MKGGVIWVDADQAQDGAPLHQLTAEAAENAGP